MAQEETEAEKEMLIALYARAELKRKKPCLECCTKRGAWGVLEVVIDKFYKATALGSHIERVHHQVYDKDLKCGQCNNYFPTLADLERHVRIMPKQH